MARGMGSTGAGFDAKGTRLGHRAGGHRDRGRETAAIDAARRAPPSTRRWGRRAAGGDSVAETPTPSPLAPPPRGCGAPREGRGVREGARAHGRRRRLVGRRGRGRGRGAEGARAREPAATKRRKEKNENRRSVFVPARHEGGRLLRGRRRRGRPPRRGRGTRQRERERKTPGSSISSPSKRSPPPEDVIVIDGGGDDASPRDASRYGASARKRQTPRSPARASARRGGAARVLCGTRSPIRTARRATGGVFPGARPSRRGRRASAWMTKFSHHGEQVDERATYQDVRGVSRTVEKCLHQKP